jgi:hypothetical protein
LSHPTLCLAWCAPKLNFGSSNHEAKLQTRNLKSLYSTFPFSINNFSLSPLEHESSQSQLDGIDVTQRERKFLQSRIESQHSMSFNYTRAGRYRTINAGIISNFPSVEDIHNENRWKVSIFITQGEFPRTLYCFASDLNFSWWKAE